MLASSWRSSLSPRAHALTYRPEYRGRIDQMPGTQTIALRPLNAAQAARTGDAVGRRGSSLSEVAARVAGSAGEIRFSPRRWCGIWRNEACCMATGRLLGAR